MGEGGVACVCLQAVMDKFPDTNGKMDGKPVKRTTTKRMKLKRDAFFKKDEPAEKVENVEVGGSSGKQQLKEEVEEGELGTLKSPKREVENGEITPDKFVKSEVEKAEFVGPAKWRKDQGDRGNKVPPATWRKMDSDRVEFGSGRFRRDRTPERLRKGEYDKGEFGSWRGVKDEVEKGEFIPDRWHKADAWSRDEYGYSKRGKLDSSREYRYEYDWTPSYKYSGEDFSSSGGGGGGRHMKRAPKWEANQERNYLKLSSKVMDEVSSGKNEYNHGRGQVRDFSARLKRYGNDSDSSDRKYYDDNADHAVSSKSRKFGHSDYHMRHSAEKAYRNPNPSASRNVSARLSGRPYDSSSKRPAAYDRQRRSPSYSERSPPRERARYHDYRDMTPAAHHEKSPCYRIHRYDNRNRSPSYLERSPQDRGRPSDYRDRSPSYEEPSSRERMRVQERRDRSPSYLEPSPHERLRSQECRDRSPSYFDGSPHERMRPQERRERSPSYFNESPDERMRSQERGDRSPSYFDESPHERMRSQERRDRSPSFFDESPHATMRPQERRDRSPSYLDESPHNRSEPGKTKQSCSSRVEEEKHTERVPRGKDLWDSSEDPTFVDIGDDTEDGLIEKTNPHSTPIQDQPESPNLENKEHPSLVNGATEELPSMEEDMDICDTPPHVPSAANVNPGKWYYIDHLGAEHGPSRLCELKALVEEGILMSDHLVKHIDSDRWVTVENAASPSVTGNYTSIFSDSVTQLVSPPEAPGNVLLDGGDAEQGGNQAGVESWDTCARVVVGSDDHIGADDLRIDDRVCALFEGKTVTPGKELEIVQEVLQVTFDKSEWESFGSWKGFTQDHDCEEKPSEQSQNEDMAASYPDTAMKDSAEITTAASVDKECGYLLTEFTEWFSGRWSCKGGDWKRNEEAVQDKYSKRKLVLNDGYPLCQMPKSGFEDPRWLKKEDLYFPCQSKRLDLPAWAFSCPDERNDAVNKIAQPKSVSVRGVKGTMLPVIRINACVVNDHGSFVSDPRPKVRAKDKYSSKSSSKHYSSSTDVKRSSGEEVLPSKLKEQSSVESWKSNVVNKPKDRLCTINDLQLHVGDWYYLDGTGQEHGPFSCSVLPSLVEQGFLKKQSSVFRKVDKLWVPVTSVIRTVKDSVKHNEENASHAVNVCGTTDVDGGDLVPGSFNSLHPQYIGYTRGTLHELVMKFYKSREFAAAINEVLDPWINCRQPKKELERNLYIKPANRSSFCLQKYPIENGLSLHEDDLHSRKRFRISIDGAEEAYDLTEGVPPLCYNEPSFEDLCRDVTFSKEENEYFDDQLKSWGLIDGHILARVFHFLRADVKSLVFAALTCKHWRAAVGFYKGLSVRIDLSTIGTNCSDHIIESIMRGYNKNLIKSLVLDGCSNITSSMLESILQSFSYISCVDIRGCNQFEELIIKYPHVNWVRNWSSQGFRIVDESNSKTKSLKQLAEQPSSVSKSSHGNYMDESSGLKDYFDMVERRGAANQAFRQNLYKRTKLVDARKSASVLAREARMRHWAMKKAGSGYKKMEEFLLLSLNDIMKGKSSDYFAPKVAEIENRIKTGYYARRGLSSAKQDIIKMCRGAMNIKNRGDGDMELMIALFIKLGTCLDESLKTAVGRDEMMRKFRDEVSGSFGNKKYSKTITERKYTSRANGSSFLNGGLDHIEYSSERDIRKKLSRMNKKMESESDSSDEYELSSDDALSDTDRDSNSEPDSDIRSEGGASESKDGCITADEYFDSTPDDREWGARMTKASLVPPVTRKYEVIDQYVIVADEEEVRRKMRVSLPDDYEDKVKAQKNGSEEVDMEIPEVKEYKPRKQLGEQVLEQEVYGIDPYTHNLLLDSMPEDGDWQTHDKHNFIEDVLLRVLNKQVRHYTGSGSTPMTYPLKPVVEEVMEKAKVEHDMRTLKLCEVLLQAIDGRTDDNYVAYRKGLGVVCNKQGGFTEDDFIVEFLGEVYPAWKWFEKQDGVRSLQKNSKEPAPEFYNIHLERPKGDADGYDLVVVDAMHKANYASRICHSCRPNCEAKVTAVSGHYQIGIYSLRPIAFGEEITFDYNSVTESKEEYEASVCLCGSQVCRGSYLNLTGEGAYQKVLKEWHGLLDKHHLLLEACELNWVSEEDYIELGKAGLGSCLLGDLPDWLIAFSARLVRFMNFERSKLPEEILGYNVEEKKKYFAEISIEFEKNEAEVQAEGVYNQRLQNLALTLDKVRYVLRCVFGNPKKAPPPLQKLSPEETVSVLWNGEDSLVKNLLDCIAPHLDDHTVEELKSEIRAHDPSNSSNIDKELKKSLLWLRDEVRNLPCTYKSRHDAAADLIHLYAYTKCFFKIREYKTITSPPVHISPLDLGPKCANKLSGVTEYCKTYGENYCLGQLIYWHNQANADPDRVLARMSRGCLSLPDISSFYAKAQKPSKQRVYGPRTVRFMLARMEKQPQRPWPKDRIWSFETTPKFFGSPMLDAVMNNSTLEKEMVNWLKNRPAIFQAKWDR